jgi:hypothetical protein
MRAVFEARKSQGPPPSVTHAAQMEQLRQLCEQHRDAACAAPAPLTCSPAPSMQPAWACLHPACRLFLLTCSLLTQCLQWAEWGV